MEKIKHNMTLDEAKIDQEAFIAKFGQEAFDKFKKLKDRLKNKGISVDMTYHTKNTSVEEMQTILYNAEKRIESSSEEEQKIKVAENDNYVIWDIKNYKTAMKYGTDTCWCITGRYNDGHYNQHTNEHPKESQAAQYFPDYLRTTYECYLFAIPKKSEYTKYCICPKKGSPYIAAVWSPSDDSYTYSPEGQLSSEMQEFRKAAPDIDYKGFSTKVKEFIISNGVLVKYNGIDTDVTLPDEVTKISSTVFRGNTNLTSITFKNVNMIDEKAFMGCSNLTTVNALDNLLIIQPEAFKDCKSLVTVNLPVTLMGIKNGAFIGCNNVKIRMVKHKITVKEADVPFLSSHIEWIQPNESLSATNESLVLNEYYSESMPDWLKAAIEDTNRHRSTRGGWGYKGLKDKLNAANIDFANAHFINDGTIPEGARDPRLKEPNIPFFHVVSEDRWGNGRQYHQVWAKGLNDEECFQIGGFSSNNKKFGSHSIKNILKYTVDFCYIDTTDPANYNKDKKQARYNMKQELDKIPNYNRGKGQYRDRNQTLVRGHYDDNGHYVHSHFEPTGDWFWSNTSGQDKSGYIIDPEKYRKKLDALGKQNYQKVLDGFYNRLNTLKQSIIDIVSDLDIKDFENSDFNDLISSNIFRNFQNTTDKYNRFNNNINNALNNSDEVEKDHALGVLFRTKDTELYWQTIRPDVKEVRESIDKLENAVKQIHSVTLGEKLNEGFSALDLVPKIEDIINNYYDESQDADDMLYDTQDSYANEMLEQNLFDTLYYSGKLTKDQIDNIYNTIIEHIDNNEQVNVRDIMLSVLSNSLTEALEDEISPELGDRILNAISKYRSDEFGDDEFDGDYVTFGDVNGLIEEYPDGIIPIAYTTSEDGMSEYQVNYDLNDRAYKFYIDDELVKTQATSIEEFINDLETGGLYSWAISECEGSYDDLTEATVYAIKKMNVEQGKKVAIEIDRVDNPRLAQDIAKENEGAWVERIDEDIKDKHNDYCVIKNGDNIATFDNEQEAIDYANKENCDKILVPEYNDDGDEIGVHCIWERELKEDTVKRGDFWVNKGSEGTHGKFRTKKGANAQRKAMFANGYHEELDEAYEDLDDDIKMKLEEIAVAIVDTLGFDHDLVLADITNDYEEQLANSSDNEQLKQALLAINPDDYASQLADVIATREDRNNIEDQFSQYVFLGEMLLQNLDNNIDEYYDGELEEL